MKAREDNMALGTLLLGLAAVIFLIWVLKVVLALFLTIAESVLTLGFYVVLVYAACALIVTLYASLFPKKTPKFVKKALALHHSIALGIKIFFRSAKSLFAAKKSSS